MTHHHGERRTAEYVSQFSSLINLSALEHWSSSEKYVHRVWPQICKPLPVLGKFKLQWASTPTKLLDMTDNLPTAGGVVKIGWTSCSSRWVAWAAEVWLVAESIFRLFANVGEGIGCLCDWTGFSCWMNLLSPDTLSGESGLQGFEEWLLTVKAADMTVMIHLSRTTASS